LVKLFEKSEGLTPSERYLAKVAERTFLLLWSYPNTFTDEGRSSHNGDGKEFCDLLVVFGDQLILFSHKYSEFPTNVEMEVGWPRWYRRAISKSVRQLIGAEKWFKEKRGTLYLDSKCQHELPIVLPEPSESTVHLVAVTGGSQNVCKTHFDNSESGSFVLDSALSYGDRMTQPFRIGSQHNSGRFIHVIDESALEITLRELDTVTDFCRYLSRKERLFQGDLGPKYVTADGEEEVVATYQSGFLAKGEGDFQSMPKNYNAIHFAEGLWREYIESEERVALEQALVGSRIWDAIIEYQSQFIQHGTAVAQDFDSGGEKEIPIDDHEWVVRALADEPRAARFVLSELLSEALDVNDVGRQFARVGVFGARDDRAYVFLIVPKPVDIDYADYRDYRREVLLAYCYGLKLKLPHVTEAVGIASEPRASDVSSQDFVRIVLGQSRMPDAVAAEVEAWCGELEILAQVDDLQAAHVATTRGAPSEGSDLESEAELTAKTMRRSRASRNKKDSL